jgi:hypothetical protein
VLDGGAGAEAEDHPNWSTRSSTLYWDWFELKGSELGFRLTNWLIWSQNTWIRIFCSKIRVHIDNWGNLSWMCLDPWLEHLLCLRTWFLQA